MFVLKSTHEREIKHRDDTIKRLRDRLLKSANKSNPVVVRVQQGPAGGWRPVVLEGEEVVLPVKVSGLTKKEAESLARRLFNVSEVIFLTYSQVRQLHAKQRRARRAKKK